ncbi:MAG: FGGY-family carbohydrate kinase [Pseudomonadota bacterium]
MTFFIGVDVGTGSARAAVFDANGRMLSSHKHDIQMWRDGADTAEQSSDDIWHAVCTCIREALAAAEVSADQIAGLGFDAACSMAVLGEDMRPLSVSASGDPVRNVIVWMDQRAKAQAHRINVQGHAVLDYVGGRISPEMQTPKLLWLKEEQPERFARAAQFFDLPDFLTWKATGSLARSACTVTCKWTYLAHEARWDPTYFHQIGLGVLADEGFARIGQEIVPPGTPLGQGLTEEAAAECGLRPGTPVGAALIDAHAGGVGTVGAAGGAGPEATMAYVFGTSACTMATSAKPHKVPGVWGPYYSAMVPGMWLSEGGQSAAGEAIAHLTAKHPAGPAAKEMALGKGLSLQAYLLRALDQRVDVPSDAARFAESRVIVPDLIGNRAPFADPDARAVIAGLSLDQGFDDLLATYVATVLGVGYGLRQIMAAQKARGVCPSAIVISGGAAQSTTIQQLLADAGGYRVQSPASPEPVLLGSAMLGAVASGHAPRLQDAMTKMSKIDQTFTPSVPHAALHDRRFEAFQMLQKADRLARGLGADQLPQSG